MESQETLNEEIEKETLTVDFGSVPVDTSVEKHVLIENKECSPLIYRASFAYVLDPMDRVFKVSVTSNFIEAGETVKVEVSFKPTVPKQVYTDYYIVNDTAGNTYRINVTGSCIGPEVVLSKKKVTFKVRKNLIEQRTAEICIINRSNIDSIYQWLLPSNGFGYFQLSIGACGVIRAMETINAVIHFNGVPLGEYVAELALLVLHQEPLFLNVVATVALQDTPIFASKEHLFEKFFDKRPYTYLMENSLNRLNYIPSASAFDRYLDFGTGSVEDITRNITQSFCVTNHEEIEGSIQWSPDPDNIFLIDPISADIPSKDSVLFNVRFRPKEKKQVYSYLLFGEFQCKKIIDKSIMKLKHTWFRISCTGNTWCPCTALDTEWECPVEVVMPPTVPGRTSFRNFLLSNKLDIPMYYKFKPPASTNFVVMPMCGLVPSRGWHIISVAVEPKSFGDYYEMWNIDINREQKARICLWGNAELSNVEIVSHGYSPNVDAMFEFPPTITGCTNYRTSYIHNLTRMFIHLRVLNSVSWLGADNCGILVIPPREITPYHWWFFPQTADLVYETTVVCSCICLIDGRPVGEPTEQLVHLSGFSELPDLRVLPKAINLHDILVGVRTSVTLTLYNRCSCFFTSNLLCVLTGLGDDHNRDRIEIETSVDDDGLSSWLKFSDSCPLHPVYTIYKNSLKPNNHCQVTFTITPDGAGMRQISVKYSVLFRSEFREVQQIQPIKKTICKIWYDSIFPTLKVKRTIAVKCPLILSNHCVLNITNVAEFNKALEDCRPNKPVSVNLYAPELCVRTQEVQLLFIMGCVYNVPVNWSLRRVKICDCEMIEVPLGISLFEMRHTCFHRPLVELSPLSGIISPDYPGYLYINFKYTIENMNTLCYVMSLSNDRSINVYWHVYAHLSTKGILTPLRRNVKKTEFLAYLDCGKVPINNLDPVIRLVWLYNPTDVFATWRLLKGNSMNADSHLRCLLYFAEVPPLGKLSIPFAFMPREMKNYAVTFFCSFGYDTALIYVKGQGGLPNCYEERLDMPNSVERIIRAANRTNVVYLSTEHITLNPLPTHSLNRDIFCICNDTNHSMRYIWLPERIANIVNIVMTPCWGVIQPKSSEWITMTVYTLQEPATFTTVVACEILDLTERKRYHRNEILRRNKINQCNQEFIITEEGLFHPGINDFPPFVLDLQKPQPFYLTLSVSVSSKGQRDGVTRLLLSQIWEQTPPYDLQSETSDYLRKNATNNNLTSTEIIRILDGVIWDTLHTRQFKDLLRYYSKEDIPTYAHLMKVMKSVPKQILSKRITSGICDAIVNKAVFGVYNLSQKRSNEFILEAEEEE